jgi:hypothetical protein
MKDRANSLHQLHKFISIEIAGASCSMIEKYSSKSSITADTAFQKDLTLQGCPNVPKRMFTP